MADDIAVMSFLSKDEHIARYYDNTFRERFEADLVNSTVPLATLQEHWRELMLREAAIQEHYDYTTDVTGVRTLITQEDGTRKLMIPKVVVV